MSTETVDLEDFDEANQTAAANESRSKSNGSNGGGFDLGSGSVISLVDTDETKSDFEPIPSDDYECFVISSEYKPSKAGNPMVETIFETDDKDDERSQYNGRRLWHYATLHNERGKRELKRLILVLNPNADMGHINLEKIDELLMNGPSEGRCRLTVKKSRQKNKETGEIEERNNIRGIKPLGGDDFLGSA